MKKEHIKIYKLKVLIKMSFVFIKKGNFCIIEHPENEIPERFIFRGYAIVSQYPDNQKQFDYLSKLSNLLINNKFLGCSYGEELDQKILTTFNF